MPPKVPKWKQKLNNEKPEKNEVNFGNLLGQIEKNTLIEQRTFNLFVHSQDYSIEEILLNKDIFEEYMGVKENDQILVEIICKGTEKIVLYVKSSQIKQMRNEVSIIKEICDVHSLSE